MSEVSQLLGSLSNQQSDTQSVIANYTLNGAAYLSILLPMQIYTRSRTTSSIDNFYITAVTFSKDQLLSSLNTMYTQVNAFTLAAMIIGVVVSLAALVPAFVFAHRFARSIEKPIAGLAEILRQVEVRYLQNLAHVQSTADHPAQHAAKPTQFKLKPESNHDELSRSGSEKRIRN